ncbi:hypothetical protein NA56DRAFT_695847 [Hyaloscypha hepaticicola]|uniref:Uncharacterized protein n=1 Tax=Hyaloscypha hepaticicola TaxID=2082293 RepID=A0A2J6QPA8_9HELO|nr:hypothetical protein NA56DRAFT_695847 [Hyaloscypha hepaticicola]
MHNADIGNFQMWTMLSSLDINNALAVIRDVLRVWYRVCQGVTLRTRRWRAEERDSSVVLSFVAAFRLPDMAHLGALNVTGLPAYVRAAARTAQLKLLNTSLPSARDVPIAPHSVDRSDPSPSQLAQCCPKRVVKAAKFLKISLVQFVQPFPGLRKCVAVWGRLASRTLGQSVHFAAVEAMSPYSKRTDKPRRNRT